MTDTSKFDELARDVDWQMHSLFSYIEEKFKSSADGRTNISATELVAQSILDAYLCLAEKFYDQFKHQLKIAYEQNSGENTSKANVSDADVAIFMQQALDKLTAEWVRVYNFISATGTKKTPETENILTQLSPLITAAIRDVGFSPETFPVVPQFGTAYSLGFFNYTDDFMALNLPITALQSPWEWTIFWHEIAGQKIRLLKKTQVVFLNVIREFFAEIKRQEQQNLVDPNHYNMQEIVESLLNLTVPSSELNTLTNELMSDFIKALTEAVNADWNSPDAANSSLTNIRNFIQDLSPSSHRFPILMFSFSDLLDGIIEELRLQQKTVVKENLRESHRRALAINKIHDESEQSTLMDNLFTAWEKALSLDETLATQKQTLDDEGWSADWLEELFEDSFTIMNFDVNFLPIFDKILRRHADGGKDLRHPPRQIRLAMASALLMIQSKDDLTKEDLPPTDAGLIAGLSKEFYPGSLGEDARAIVWLTAKRFHEMHDRIKMPNSDLGGIIQKVKDAITDAIKIHASLDSPEELEKLAVHVLDSLAGMASELTNSLLSTTDTALNKNNYEQKIQTLLTSRNIIPPRYPLGYRELLDLSFYDEDFLETTITNVMVNGIPKNWTIKCFQMLTSAVMNGTPQRQVTYMVDGKPRGTTTYNWNHDGALSGYLV